MTAHLLKRMALIVFGFAQKLQGVWVIRCSQTLTLRFLLSLRQHFFMSRDSRKTCFLGGKLKKKTKLSKKYINCQVKKIAITLININKAYLFLLRSPTTRSFTANFKKLLFSHSSVNNYAKICAKWLPIAIQVNMVYLQAKNIIPKILVDSQHGLIGF